MSTLMRDREWLVVFGGFCRLHVIFEWLQWEFDSFFFALLDGY